MEKREPVEEEREWAFSLDAFLSADSAFLGGREYLGAILQQALENNQALAEQASEALVNVRMRDPRNRKDPDPAHPTTPGELFISENSLKLLVHCAQTIQDGLAEMPDRWTESRDDFNLVDEILKNVRLRARKFKKNRPEDQPTE
jgi:hypothetical protein